MLAVFIYKRSIHIFLASFYVKKATSSITDTETKRSRNDTVPPEIQIISPQLDSTQTTRTSASTSYVIDRLRDESGIQSVTINDSIVPCDENGFFQQIYPVNDGLNVFKIDATFLYSTLMGKYTFEHENITLLRDASRADIIRTLDKLSNQLSRAENLLIFYAGHGYWDKKKETGYWLPADAEQSSSGELNNSFRGLADALPPMI